MSNTLAAKNDLQGSATTLAATSWLSTDQTMLCPPMVGSDSPITPSVKCSAATNAITLGTSFASRGRCEFAGQLRFGQFGGIAGRNRRVQSRIGRQNPRSLGALLHLLPLGKRHRQRQRYHDYFRRAPTAKSKPPAAARYAGGDDLIVVWTHGGDAKPRRGLANDDIGHIGDRRAVRRHRFAGRYRAHRQRHHSRHAGRRRLTTLGAITGTDIANTPISGSTGSFTPSASARPARK